MSSTLDIRRRIKSIRGTRQITKAMEKISAIKMRRAQIAATQSRRYAALAWEMIRALQGNVNTMTHPLLAKRTTRRVGFVVVSPDKGLCGSLPARLIQKIVSSGEAASFKETRWYTLGKKGRDALVRMGAHLEADFGSVPSVVGSAYAASVVGPAISDYLSGKIDVLYLGFTDFVNTLVQTPTVRQILPFQENASEPERARAAGVHRTEYVFEPSPEEVLENLLMRILELQVYQAVLESNASEHSARMVAMKNASENAGDLIDDFTLEYNQVRQAGITREIAEISAGRIALES